MDTDENGTLKAVSELRKPYPYAAALLVYVVIERLYKEFVLEWGDPALASRLRLKLTLVEAQEIGRESYLNKYLDGSTLGQVEQVLSIPEAKRCAKDRNEIMHSNLFRAGEKHLPHDQRSEKNELRLERALDHLQFVAGFVGLTLVNDGNELRLDET